MINLAHNYAFDPCYGYSFNDLLGVRAPFAPDDFADFWLGRYRKILTYHPQYSLTLNRKFSGFLVYDLSFSSSNGFQINGWLLVPENGIVKRGIVVGHGYGGREQPDFNFGIPNTAFLFPCFRGISRSRCPELPDQPQFHVLHGIDNRDDYVIGGCVEDLWLSVTVLLDLYPKTAGNIGYMGISFGGGIGALALPWDTRIGRGHFNVPTFGNQPLRLSLPTVGSAAAVKSHSLHNDHITETLVYYDAAIASGFARQPGHFALAVFDPVVAPPGQFAIYNAWAGEKSLFVLDAGHFDYPSHAEQEQQLLAKIREFFGELSH